MMNSGKVIGETVAEKDSINHLIDQRLNESIDILITEIRTMEVRFDTVLETPIPRSDEGAKNPSNYNSVLAKLKEVNKKIHAAHAYICDINARCML